MSLLELLAVIAIMGVLATAVTSRYGRSLIGNTGVRNEARRLSLGLLEAQRASIKSGLQHGVQLNGGTSNATSWSIIRIESDGTRSVIDGPLPFNEELRVTSDASEIFFDFEGNGTTEFNVSFVGPERSWALSVLPLTRMIDSRETTP